MQVASGVKSIDALRRGLEVLHAVAQSSAVTLSELHRQTGIAKATLSRILKTLREAGWIERHPLEARYVPAAAQGAWRRSGARACLPSPRRNARCCSAGFPGPPTWRCATPRRC
jgi:hypothetical protein